jgi:hypothetical protein
LRALLDEDRVSGIPAARSGKIHRSHYARQLGCVPSALGRFKDVFKEYERELGIATGPMRHIQQMRHWLRSAYDSKSLKFSKGKVDRKEFQSRFGLRGGTFMVRHPEIRTLFEEFDARAQRENYFQAVVRTELDRFQKALADGPELNKDRLTINQVALARTLGVTKNRFRDKAFADALALKESEILEAVSASRIDPYFHGRVYAFSTLTSTWPFRFLERIGFEFKKGFSGGSAESAKGSYLQIYAALEFIGTSEIPHCTRVLQEAIETGRIVQEDDWEEALHAYRNNLLARVEGRDVEATSVATHVTNLRSALAILSTSRLVPETSVPLPGIRLARHRRGHLRSVAETSPQSNEGSKTDYVEFARARFHEVCKAQGILIDAEESTGFLDGLATEIERASNLPTDAASAIRLVLERRLNALQTAAIGLFRSEKIEYDRGQELLSMANIDGKGFEDEYFENSKNDRERAQIMREAFPNHSTANVDEVIQGLANLLGLIEQRHSGIPPPSGSHETGPHGQFFAKRYLEYGGMRTITPLLIPAPEAVGAVLTLYLIEGGANVSVGRTLDEDCEEASDLEGHRRITGSKARAKGKPIIVDLPEDSPAVQAIQWLRSATGRLRACAGDDSDRLFLMRIGSRVQLMTPHWYTGWFKTFASSTPGLQGLGITPNMLRPSVLLHAALSNDGRLATGMALAQHGLSVTQGYQKKFPTILLYDENIRRFQAAFETLVMSGVEDAANKLGITAEQFEARLVDLRPTGLGTFCKDQRGRPGQGTSKCPTMDCWNDCPHLMIVAEVEAIAALQIWQASLRAVRPEWERDRPERWDEVWLPWLCLTDVVAEKMARGPLIKVWKQACDLVTKISSQPNFVPPQPW